MYRFRPISSLLDKFNELENQEIYFATPEELNDPMEGFRDVFWNGDTIVWRNLIINYIKAVEHFFSVLVLIGDRKKIDDAHILAEPHQKIYKTSEDRDLIEWIIQKAFKNEFVINLPEYLSQRSIPIRREELLSYLESMHPLIINAVSDTYYQYGLTAKRFLHQAVDMVPNAVTKKGNLINIVNKMEAKDLRLKAQRFFSVIYRTSQQVRLSAIYNHADSAVHSNSFFLVSEFPERYLSKLETSIYPDWYSASFLGDCSNSALWAHYGDNHKGVCLKYRTQAHDSKIEMNLHVVYGASGDQKVTRELSGMRPQEFRKISYHSKHVEIDFFRSLARMNRSQLDFFWYSDQNGNLSNCSDHLSKDQQEDEWRENYWDNFLKSVSVKLSAWEFEQEYRLIIHGDFHDYTDREKRKLKYDFNDLDGIIFGIKTGTADKIRIMKIIESKCKANNRKEFNFYQAYYSIESGKIETIKLDLLKFEWENQ